MSVWANENEIKKLKEQLKIATEKVMQLYDHLDACGAYMSQKQCDEAKEQFLSELEKRGTP